MMKNDGSERMVMVVCDRTIAMDGDAMHARYLYAANKQHSIQSSEIIQRGARGIGKDSVQNDMNFCQRQQSRVRFC